MVLLRNWAAGLRARLIDDARHAWRYASVWLAGGGAVLIEIWNQLPVDVRGALPAPVARTAPSVILLLVVAGRLVKQAPRG